MHRRILPAFMLVLAAILALSMGACGGGASASGNPGGGGTPLSNDASLSSLAVSQGVLNPQFSPDVTSYSAMFIGSASVTVTPSVGAAGATVTVNNAATGSGTPSGSIGLVAGSNTITVKVTAPDGATEKTYTITAVRLSQQAYAKASNAQSNDQFGYSLALSDTTLVVGAPRESSSATGIDGNASDNSASQSGAVYVFTRSGTTWNQQAYLKASNTDASDGFGGAVAISGDTLVVGAAGEGSNTTGVNGNQADNSALASGAVYVFTRSGTIWSQQAYLKASNTDASDWFGSAVAISGDTLVVGARGEGSNATGVNGNQADNSAPGSGAAYVFIRSGTTWSQQAYLKASSTGASDHFGCAAAISGDTLVVGALDEDSSATGVNGNASDNSASSSGAGYVFTRSGTTWSQQAYLKASNTNNNDRFGSGVAVAGDTIAVGAYGESSSATGLNGNQWDNSAPGSGAVYVFTRSGATWSQQAYLKASNPNASDNFGHSVALSNDALVAGAPQESSNAWGIDGDQANNSASDSGSAYLFTRSGSTWTQQAYIKASNTNTSDLFGYSVALSGDTFAACAPGEASSTTGVDGNQGDNSAPDSDLWSPSACARSRPGIGACWTWRSTSAPW